MARTEDLYTAMLNGEATDITPRSRKEQFLKNCCDKCGCEGLPMPRTREEALLYRLAEQMAGSGGGTTELPKITDASYLFYHRARILQKDKLLSMLKDVTTCSYMFYRCGKLNSETTVTEDQLLRDAPYFDTSKCRDFAYMFADCYQLKTLPLYNTQDAECFAHMFDGCDSLVTIPEFDLRKSKVCQAMFYSCKSLKALPKLYIGPNCNVSSLCRYCSALTTVPYLDLDSATSVSSMSDACAALTNLTLYNIRKTLQIGSGTSWGHLLTVDSLVHTIKELCTVTTGQTLTMGSANLEKISGLYCKIIDDTDEKKPMELCESTDEGAITLSEYAAEKGWQFK